MKLGKKLKMLRHLKDPKKIPEAVKKAFEESPHRKGIELMTFNTLFEKMDYAPFEKALDNAITGKKLGYLDKKRLQSLTRILQKGKGYTERTRKAFEEELPEIVERACKNQTTEEDKENLTEVKKWLEYNKQTEKMQILEKRKLI